MNQSVLQKPVPRGGLPAADRARLAEALRLQQAGQMAQAEPLLRQLLQRHPSSFDALSALGVFACKLGRFSDGVTLLRGAVAADPKQPDAFVDLASALRNNGDTDSALACIDMAVNLDATDDAARLLGAGWLLHDQRQADAGRLLAPMLESADAAPDSGGQGPLRAARASLALGQQQAARQRARQAAQWGLKSATDWTILGELFMDLAEAEPAAEAFDKALAAHARLGAAWRGSARAHIRLRNFSIALRASEQAMALEPSLADTWNLLGAALSCLSRYEDAAEAFRQALQLDPNQRATLSNMAHVLLTLHRYEDAALVFERLLAVWPDAEYAKGKLLHCKDLVCDWLNRDQLLAAIERDIDAGLPAAEPFGLQGFCASPARLQRAARSFGAAAFPDRSAGQPAPTSLAHGKIRVGYVSGEFRHQATSILLVNLLERHDRERFEIIAFDNGYADDSSYRRRIEAAVSEVVPISALSDAQALAAIRERGIDVLVNLNGYFGMARNDLFALRPAPVQVNYLGFPGTMGVTYMDYLVADATIIPDEHLGFYDEAVVRLPDTYQPTDSLRPVAAPAAPATRRAHGLPEEGVVFCNFNNSYKITPEIFEVWMRLLEAVPGSVLWLLEVDDAEAVKANLVAEAAWRGMPADRLVFAPHRPVDEHMARLPLADLGLDTLPYNAHTTGSDLLWAGVPMVTCLGTSFAGRVGASLLRAAGLPELVTHSLADYEALALRLAQAPIERAALRQRLAELRVIAPLFDTDRYRLHLEAAYGQMVWRARAGLPAAAFDVQALPAPTPHSQVRA
jgi:predicted O-linked N-acetylglucosamine transferase (SPINDLY family)